jgi:hypothetical protein
MFNEAISIHAVKPAVAPLSFVFFAISYSLEPAVGR